MSLPAESLQRAVAIVGATGSGKTYMAKGEVENRLEAKARVCIIDPTGAWWGLRSSADGQSAGFPVVIFGGEHADLEITDEHGEELGRVVAERSLQCVIDVSLMTMGGRVRFMTKFLEELYRLNRSTLFLVFDEADLFAPQRPMPDQNVMLNRVEQIVRRGRIRGFRPWMITQRPAELHKSVLSQAGTLVALSLRAPQDRDAIGAWIEGQADRDEGKKLLADLPKLKTGNGYVWCPDANVLHKKHFPKIRTFDSSRTPEDGDDVEEPATLATVDLEAIKTSLANSLKEYGDGLKGTQRKGASSPAPSIDVEAIRKAAHDEGYALGHQVGIGTADAVLKYLSENMPAAIAGTINDAVALRDAQGFTQSKPANGHCEPVVVRSGVMTLSHIGRQAIARAEAGGTERGAGGAELRVLRVLAARSPARFTRAQWATLAGMKKTGGTWQTYVSRLRQAGYIEERDGLVGLTPAGAKAAGHVSRPNAGSVIEDWKEALGTGPAKMIDQLIAAHPQGLDRANLADRVGMTANGGTFQTYLSRLKANGLVDVDKRRVKASETLFIDGRR